MKKLITGAIAGAALFASVMPAFGHGMGSGPAAIHPEEPSCIGQLASMHAKKFKGVSHTNHIEKHPGDPDKPLKTFETVQDQMHAFKTYCEAE